MKKIIFEVFGLTFFVFAFLKVAQFFLSPDTLSVLIPSFLLYLPILVLLAKKAPVDFLDRSFKQFFMGAYEFGKWVLLAFPPYLFATHFWMIHFFGMTGFRAAPWEAFGAGLFYQLFAVALPEEFYFRGYFQTRLKPIFQGRWKIFGARLGVEWPLTAAFFALAHSVLLGRWWDFSIFFPALLFGYLREKTGSITAPVLFHAFSNCLMNWVQASYY